MKKTKSPKARLIISLLKLIGIALSVTFIALMAKSLSIHPALMLLIVLFVVSVIRTLYRFICMIAALGLLILIICSLCLI